jgi:acyl carrier protein
MDDLSKVEIFLMVEREFDLQLPDDQVERFLNVKEAVEYVSKSFHAH